eukprot:scaffold1902_cov80-Skeletonema_marinoi.AAC.3
MIDVARCDSEASSSWTWILEDLYVGIGGECYADCSAGRLLPRPVLVRTDPHLPTYHNERGVFSFRRSDLSVEFIPLLADAHQQRLQDLPAADAVLDGNLVAR